MFLVDDRFSSNFVRGVSRHLKPDPVNFQLDVKE